MPAIPFVKIAGKIFRMAATRVTLATVVLAVPHPAFATGSLSIQSLSLSGTTLTMTGGNGVPDGQYVVLASTNLTLQPVQWTPVTTNHFDGSGNFYTSFDIAGTVDPNSARQFFTVLEQTNLLTRVATPVFSPIAAPYYAETPVTITSATGVSPEMLEFVCYDNNNNEVKFLPHEEARHRKR